MLAADLTVCRMPVHGLSKVNREAKGEAVL